MTYATAEERLYRRRESNRKSKLKQRYLSQNKTDLTEEMEPNVTEKQANLGINICKNCFFQIADEVSHNKTKAHKRNFRKMNPFLV